MATETSGKPWMDLVNKGLQFSDYSYYVIYERGFKDFADYKLIRN